MRVESRSVGSHDAAKVIACFWYWATICQNKMKDKTAKHTESGGGQRHCKRMVCQYFKSERRDSFGRVCHASKMGCALSFVKHGANVEAFVVVFVGYF